jgi:Gas vesicle synthesis protein GvpO
MSVHERLYIPTRVRKAREQVHELTGCEPVSVSGLARVDGGGWELHVDVVEVRRIPDTASLLATYRVTTDEAGDVTGYERVRRFTRSQAS